MHVHAHLDVDVLALEQDDTVHVLLELAAPPAPVEGAPRPPQTIVVLLDRSGSMAGERLASAREALLHLVERLDPSDRLGVVVFDHEAQVVLPTGPLGETGRARAAQVVRAIEARGNTDLSSGYLRALQEARSATGETGATIVVLSDGHANQGITDPDALGALAAEWRGHGITTSTIGIGLGYDERILVAVAEGGSGNHAFAEEAEKVVVALAAEVEGLLSKTVQAAHLVIKPGPDIAQIAVLNDLPSMAAPEGILVELGDLYAEEQRRLVLAFEVPGRAALGLAQIGELVLSYVELPALIQHTVALPLAVNVLPGDEAAGRVRSPEVEKERLLLEVQRAKKVSEERLRAGDVAGASASLALASADLMSAPFASDTDVADELAWLARSQQLYSERDAAYNLKRSTADRTGKARGSRDHRRGGER